MADLSEEIERAVAANRWVEDNPELPDNRFERCADPIAARGVEALQPLTVLLADADPHRRATAAYLLGRLGEANESLRTHVKEHLLVATSGEKEDQVIDALAIGASLSGLARDEALALLRAPHANLRRVAAHHLALAVSSDEEDEPVRAALRAAGASDTDQHVLGWAQFGLDTAGDERADPPTDEE